MGGYLVSTLMQEIDTREKKDSKK